MIICSVDVVGVVGVVLGVGFVDVYNLKMICLMMGLLFYLFIVEGQFEFMFLEVKVVGVKFVSIFLQVEYLCYSYDFI